MSAISKLYGTQEQYMELYSWLLQNRKGKYVLSMYPKDEYKDNEPRTIACFSEEEDMDLLETCPLTWVTEQIKAQYNIDNVEFDKYINWITTKINPHRKEIGHKPMSYKEAIDCWNIMAEFNSKFH